MFALKKSFEVNIDVEVWKCLSGTIMLTQQYHHFDLCLKSNKTRLLFDWQACQRVNEDWHLDIENAVSTKKKKAQVFSWHCFFCGKMPFFIVLK